MYAIIYNVVSSPRERMVVSAALLIRERGAQATAISDVLKHSGAPRGSAYHYFPGGRMQLLEEATEYAGQYIAAKISAAHNSVELLDDLIDGYRQQLIRSDYRAGCPIVAARASRDVKPLDLVQKQLRELLQAETGERKSR